jgi:hypothetical protein
MLRWHHGCNLLFWILESKNRENSFFFKSPAKHLQNIIVDFNNNKVNQPVYVKHKRRSRPSADDSDSEISDVTSGNIWV